MGLCEICCQCCSRQFPKWSEYVGEEGEIGLIKEANRAYLILMNSGSDNEIPAVTECKVGV